jgi:hypothetical protein
MLQIDLVKNCLKQHFDEPVFVSSVVDQTYGQVFFVLGLYRLYLLKVCFVIFVYSFLFSCFLNHLCAVEWTNCFSLSYF